MVGTRNDYDPNNNNKNDGTWPARQRLLDRSSREGQDAASTGSDHTCDYMYLPYYYFVINISRNKAIHRIARSVDVQAEAESR